MKMLMLAGILSTTLPLAVSADVSREDVKKLHAAGVAEEVILTYVRTNGPMARLSPDDLVELKKSGVSDRLLEALVAPPSLSSKPVAEPSYPESMPRTTYVYNPSPSYGYPYHASYLYSSSPYYVSPYYDYGHGSSHHGLHHSTGSHGLGGHLGGGHSGGHHSGGHHRVGHR